ncbi:MAG: hypothetical protein J0L53_01070 [Spirochaetes bacterium]|nr:hypothetical protein [Spirochaetota bacterium]MBX3723975.1 hypothetical protein [Turneriella sp.]
MRLFAAVAVFVLSLGPAMALQKVMILPIVNIDKDANFAYLEGSITDSLKERLREKLAFDELPEEKWNLIAEQNFILRDDFHTRTAAMNLGILTNQDIVISGGFKPVNAKLGGGRIKTSIHATAYLLDIKKKKIIATVSVDLPADSELFTSINQVADRMEAEARKVIPSKEDAARSGLQSAGEPFFSDWSIGLNAGAGLYVSGYAKYFTPQLPALGATMRARMPRFARNLVVAGGFNFLNHKLKEGGDSALQSLGASSLTTNYMFSMALGYQLGLGTKFYLEPQLGGGYVLQSTAVTGNGINSTLSNGFPLARAGATAYYRLNPIVDVSLGAESLMYIEQGTMTFVPLVLAGLHYKF